MLRSADFWTGVAFALCGGFLFFIAQEYSMGTPQRIGPGYFPSGVSALLFLLGVFIAGKSVLAPGEKMDPLNPRALMVIVAIVLFAFLLRSFGLFLTAIITSVVSSMASSEGTWKQAILIAVAVGVLVTVIFGVLLGVQINLWPRWM